MQIFPCPFCGARDEREFSFLGPVGKLRPDTRPDMRSDASAEVSAAQWAAYLYDNPNPKGGAREVWMHLTCGEVFVMERDTCTMEVLAVLALRKDAS